MFKIKDLSYRYPKNQTDTIKGISFEVKQGEIFGFLGPSGAGKSTTQKLLIKLLEGYEGEINYLDKPLNTFKESFYQDVGVSFEMPIHFSKLTASENIEFFKRFYKKTIDTDKLLKQVGLYEDKDKKVGEYSKGMKIRLNFVRAMINDPKILFLDEPTNGLDPTNAKILKDLILDFKARGGTVFLTTHIMNDVEQLCDRVGFIKEGRIIEIDTPKNLKLKYGKKVITVEYKDDNQLTLVTFDQSTIKTNEAFFDLMKHKEIVTIHSGETTLEEIFIKVTKERIV